MDPKDRAELDRLLDLAEKEQLLAAAPTPEQEQAYERLVAERSAQVSVMEREHELVRCERDALASAAEWLD